MRRISAVLGALVACGALVTGVANAGDERRGDAGYRADIAWAPCVELADVECGTVAMPVDWGDPRGEKFDLALARRKATDPAAREGVLLVNPGGPGDSGVDYVLGGGPPFSAELLARFDVIGVDPRGVARSNPVLCSKGLVEARPLSDPVDQAGFAALKRYNRELAADCRERTGPLFDHVDTLSGVEDMDAVRRSLGEREVSYYGVSYGTLLGQQYARRHGDRLRAMVLDSTMDHDQDTWEFSGTQAVGAEGSFREFLAWCGRNASCALHGRDVPALWAELLVRVDRGELTHPNVPGVVLDRDLLRWIVVSTLYAPTWAELAGFLAALEAQRGGAVAAVAEPELLPNALEVFCQDWRLPVRDHREFARLSARADRLAPNMRGTVLAEQSLRSCVGREGAADTPQRPWRVAPGTPKVLVVNALHDPATPHAWAVDVHRQARGAAVLLTYEGWGHGVYGRGACADGAVDRYLVDLVVPRDGTRCAGTEPQTPAASTGLPEVVRPGWGG
ncbi:MULTISPECIES: alpha/beta hydrolase [Actinosynnema]|uniref:alpha/beta hydrolase n=1 Tax=Actinosynnema TaxID=40566 RepID=UPI0020A48554|nr:alpha/beta hydrolase [Actinosynnema pretiosum]MCP2092226.1 alpha/beta hydrolase fold [Actinosynnema pretiosum]